ncbi:gluconate 2-dehydrogenase subunit 3 family protein [Novosphingobium huizhouense]|uniref:gluconate 2-dehydrogenase subunit 3 family protein n=1 Tax=Novosphingobium huizhouense TaxID=2866625 RepID=UPI001CD87B47|nr:gluconate 2-dehydrogenase subunit 3 family protein [Novosphingobium huizhouense]
MTDQAQGWNRRDFLGGAALLALALGVPTASVMLSPASADEAPSDRQMQVLARVADLVIPRTETPGAVDTGVPAFVALALAHGLSASRTALVAPDSALRPFLRADSSLRHLPWLEATLDRNAQGNFLAIAPAEQARILTALDAAAFPPGPPPQTPAPWATIKGLILTGYYTSEPGGAQELRYELVPGRFDPDIALAPGDRAWSSDWTAVEFG